MKHQSKISYKVIAGWPCLPEGLELGHITGVGVDSLDRVHVLSRQRHSVFVFGLDGGVVDRWGEDILTNPHGICIGPDDSVYVADVDDHTVRKFSPDGNLLYTLGTEGCEGEQGKPFHRPTDVALAPTGELYVSDGYNGPWVHKFSPDGELLRSWGKPGAGPGEFNLPHGIWVGRDCRVWVADRENHRIQIFSPDGEFLAERTGFKRPCNIFIDDDEGLVYVPELAERLTILDLEGRLLARWTEWSEETPGRFVAPHAVWTDSHGDLYVAEVLEGRRVQKFARASVPG